MLHKFCCSAVMGMVSHLPFLIEWVGCQHHISRFMLQFIATTNEGSEVVLG